MPYVVLGQFTTAPGFKPMLESQTWGARFTLPEWKNHTLNMDERFTISIADVIKLDKSKGIRLYGADILIVVSYKPWLLPFSREKVFRFITRQQTDGNLYWYSYPMQ